ncbi:inositol monophosphatase family protein [Parvularcula maris]|uniref:Inositol monophosphatase n=1 Tax=Parvularcula maris TaxID=2965077 RepID=A0A9X2L932_9PROT|nr:inositol monophosphatase [Parvularcula maris]MCQ8185375.1 inositol monophosphatase [Parvularcula maris]
MTDLVKAEALLREAAETFIMPRWRSLSEGEVEEKSGPQDLVTVADREAELFLTRALEDLLPGSKVIGEEAVSAGTVSAAALAGEGTFWLVDPVDGTNNFVHGSDRFGVMAALVRDQKVRAGLIYLPVDGRCAVAEEGSGAFFGGERLRCGGTKPFSEASGDFSRTYVEEPYRSTFDLATRKGRETRQGRCSAYAYTDTARGIIDYVIQYIMTPWDHAPGQIIVEEAGGRFGFLPDGEAYTPVAREPRPMLVTGRAGDWEGYAEVLGEV